MKHRIPLALAIALSAVGGAKADDLTTPIPAAPAAPESVMARRVATTLGLPEPQEVATIDLDNDGFPELLGVGEGGARVFRLDAKAWRDIANGQFPAVRSLGELTFLERRFNGMPVISAGGTQFALFGGNYQPLDAITPATYDLGAFQAACEKSQDISMVLEDNGAPASEAAPFCACIGGAWLARNPEQSFFDTYVRELGGEYRNTDRDDRAEADTLISLIDEGLYDCRAKNKWTVEPPYPFGQPMFNGKPQPDSAASFVEACRVQDWLIADKAVGTPDRTLGLCGCVAGSLALNGMSGKGFEMIAALYSGERSENEINEEDPSAVAASDEVAGACVKALPYR
jgi:hypothetical protein